MKTVDQFYENNNNFLQDQVTVFNVLFYKYAMPPW